MTSPGRKKQTRPPPSKIASPEPRRQPSRLCSRSVVELFPISFRSVSVRFPFCYRPVSGPFPILFSPDFQSRSSATVFLCPVLPSRSSAVFLCPVLPSRISAPVIPSRLYVPWVRLVFRPTIMSRDSVSFCRPIFQSFRFSVPLCRPFLPARFPTAFSSPVFRPGSVPSSFRSTLPFRFLAPSPAPAPSRCALYDSDSSIFGPFQCIKTGLSTVMMRSSLSTAARSHLGTPNRPRWVMPS